MPSYSLPPGRHEYEDILSGLREGRYRFARVRSAAGRLHFLIGVSPRQLLSIKRLARENKVGLILFGSRVCGPRTRQHQLHPILKALPLFAEERTPSPTHRGATGVKIEKTAIKELGRDDLHTSDLTVFVIDPARDDEALTRLCASMEERLRGLDVTFPIKVFPGWKGQRWRSEQEFLEGVSGILGALLPKNHAHSASEIHAALREIYAPLGLGGPRFTWADAGNGAWNAVLASISFSIALGYHPIITAVGFGFGFFGRYLARLKTAISHAPADTPATNALALLADTAIGAAVMFCLINPFAGFNLDFSRILWASALHTLSKGSLRLALDKFFSQRSQSHQNWGVFAASTLSFIQGLATAFVYAGSGAAVALQMSFSALGLWLVFRRPGAGRAKASQVLQSPHEAAGAR